MQRQIDLTGKVDGLSSRATMAVEVFQPEQAVGDPFLPGLVVLVAGGTFGAENYFYLPGYPDYSFAQYLATRGYCVATMDSLGTGGSYISSLNGFELTTDHMAAAIAVVVNTLKADLSGGRLIPGVTPPACFTALLGHSMGGYLALKAQAQHQCADALVLQGAPNNFGPLPGFTEEVIQRLQQVDEDGFVSPLLDLLHPYFYGKYMPPPDILQAIEQRAVRIPLYLLRETAFPGAMAEYAGQVDVPVLLEFAEDDPVIDPLRELSLFPLSPSRERFLQPQAAHCGMFAPPRSRELLWSYTRRYADWRRDVFYLLHTVAAGGAQHS